MAKIRIILRSGADIRWEGEIELKTTMEGQVTSMIRQVRSGEDPIALDIKEIVAVTVTAARDVSTVASPREVPHGQEG